MITGNGKFSWMKHMYLYALLLTKSKELISTKYKVIMHDFSYVVESVKAFSTFTYFSISEYIHWCRGVSLLHRFHYGHIYT